MSQPQARRMRIELADEAATCALAAAVARLARVGDVIALLGDLGTGKTVFARAFIEALGGEEEEVPSPTFTLVQAYELSPATVYHFDLFRLADAEEVRELGMEDAFAEGISLIEWPEKLAELLPPERLDVHLAMGPEPGSRRVELIGRGAWAARMEEAGLG